MWDHPEGPAKACRYRRNSDFEFIAPGRWDPVALAQPGAWTRKTTNLDDGLRYQCAAPWDFSRANPEWNCDNFAPVPGRETRDMGRKDYDALARGTRVIVYPSSWVERQNNVKTQLNDGQRTPLARELGRTWYVRQPDAICDEARAYAQQNMVYWQALRESWEEFLATPRSFRERATVDGVSRYAALLALEDEYAARVAADPALLPELKAKIRAILEKYRIAE